MKLSERSKQDLIVFHTWSSSFRKSRHSWSKAAGDSSLDPKPSPWLVLKRTAAYAPSTCASHITRMQIFVQGLPVNASYNLLSTEFSVCYRKEMYNLLSTEEMYNLMSTEFSMCYRKKMYNLLSAEFSVCYRKVIYNFMSTEEMYNLLSTEFLVRWIELSFPTYLLRLCVPLSYIPLRLCQSEQYACPQWTPHFWEASALLRQFFFLLLWKVLVPFYALQIYK